MKSVRNQSVDTFKDDRYLSGKADINVKGGDFREKHLIHQREGKTISTSPFRCLFLIVARMKASSTEIG